MCDKCGCEHDEFTPEREAQHLATYGWYAHFIVDGDYCPYSINYHTHGLPEKYNHRDIQFCVPTDVNLLHRLAWGVIEEIKKGNNFEPGKTYDTILEGYDVKAILAMETGREVIRICFPDNEGKFEDGKLGKQFLMLTNQPVKHEP